MMHHLTDTNRAARSEMVYRINPLLDHRWPQFLESHPEASVFHTPAWLEALHRTYGYESSVWTTSTPNEAITNGVPLCLVDSWLTGSRLISVPFADHCQPLVSDSQQLITLLAHIGSESEQKKAKFIELRPTAPDGLQIDGHEELKKTSSFYHHILDLQPDLTTIYSRFHKSCVERKIRRAQREGLVYEEGVSEPILRKFHFLLAMTRRRHGIPPQPFSWFKNLAVCFKDKMKVRIVSKDGQPVASILTLHYKDKLVYKYGGSDERFHSLGGMAFLFWQTIRDGKQMAATELDLGRTDLSDQGLLEFKNRLGAVNSTVNYYRYALLGDASGADFRRVYKYLPKFFVRALGTFLYRHAG